jgi:hypothetical protein
MTHPLEDRNRESSSLTSTRLGLSDTVTASDDGHDSSLLDGGRSLETVGVNTSEKVTLQLHVIEADKRQHCHLIKALKDLLVGNLVPVGFN